MAIRDTSKKPFIVDRDSNKSIGLDLPIVRGIDSDGYFATTKTTIEAVKNNIRNLLNTEPGERFFQPTLGIDLRKFVFSNITEESALKIKDQIQSVFNYWLPFVNIENLVIDINEDNNSVQNSIIFNIDFTINRDPDTLVSIQVSVDTNTQTLIGD